MAPERDQLAALVSNIAKETRGILSNLYLAAVQAIPREAREQDEKLDAKAAVLDHNYYRLLRLTNTLSAAELMLSETPLAMQDCDLVALVSGVCEASSDLAELLGVRLRFLCAMDYRVCALHPDSVEQLLYHLLSNALKFTPAGGEVTVQLKKSGKNLLLSVSDMGCGIPPERLETLFDHYLHSAEPAPPPHGLGLGLPLCRRIAECHGGTLLAQSAAGQGSRFTLSIPERRLGDQLSDIPPLYSSGFHPALVGLADALPARAFSVRGQD